MVPWKGKTAEEATWEHEISLRSQFPGLSLEDKTVLQEEDIDGAQRVNGANEALSQEVKHNSRWGRVYVRKKSGDNNVVWLEECLVRGEILFCY